MTQWDLLQRGSLDSLIDELNHLRISSPSFPNAYFLAFSRPLGLYVIFVPRVVYCAPSTSYGTYTDAMDAQILRDPLFGLLVLQIGQNNPQHAQIMQLIDEAIQAATPQSIRDSIAACLRTEMALVTNNVPARMGDRIMELLERLGLQEQPVDDLGLRLADFVAPVQPPLPYVSVCSPATGELATPEASLSGHGARLTAWLSRGRKDGGNEVEEVVGDDHGVQEAEEDGENEDDAGDEAAGAGLTVRQCATSRPPILPALDSPAEIVLHISHEHVNTGGNPATDVHYLIKVPSMTSNSWRKDHVLDDWTSSEGSPQWTLADVEAALHVRVTGARATPLAPLLAYHAGCMVRCGGGDQTAIMQA